MLIKAEESSPEAYKIGKTPELPGAAPWTPPGVLRPASRDGVRAVSRSTLVSPAASTFFDSHSFENDGQLQKPS